jgi:hypothetical protein
VSNETPIKTVNLPDDLLTMIVLILADSYVADIRAIKNIAGLLEAAEISAEGLEALKTSAQELSVDAAKSLSGLVSVRKNQSEDWWSLILARFPGMKALEDDMSRFQALSSMVEANVPLPENPTKDPVFKFGEDL